MIGRGEHTQPPDSPLRPIREGSPDGSLAASIVLGVNPPMLVRSADPHRFGSTGLVDRERNSNGLTALLLVLSRLW